jgi:chromosome partitioning protein
MRLAAVNMKGGVGKTTTCVYLSTLLHRQGRTLAVDTDPQGSLLSWSSGLPFTVVSLPVQDVHRRLADLAAGYDHVVIDTPPGDTAIIRSAVLAVPLVIVPVSATGLDIDRMSPTWDLLSEIEPAHPLGLAVGVLLTRVRRGTRARTEAREVLTDLQYPVLETEIPLSERFSVTFGATPTDFGAYEDLLTELK